VDISRAALALMLLSLLALAAFAAAGCSDDVALASPNPDTSAPAVPDGLDARLTDARTVYLTWNANLSDPDLAGYVVYRSSNSAGPYVAASTAVSSNVWTDSKLQAGQDYFYRVAAVDVNNNLSALSAITRVRLAGKDQAAVD
jgi:hypothetical protein